jgi:hypothetical protein
MEVMDDSDGLGVDLPSLNHSPQLFSGFTPGGPTSLTKMSFHDDNIAVNGDDNGDPKRRRIARVSDRWTSDSQDCPCRLISCSIGLYLVFYILLIGI